MDKYYTYVWCPACREEHDTGEVEFLNIEEDITGRDRMTFKCVLSGEQHDSLVYSKR